MRPHRYTVLKKVENRINWQWMLKFETPAQFPLTFVSTSNFLRLFNWLSILVAIDFHSIQTHSHFATNFQHRIFSSTEGTTIVGNEIDCRTAVECKFDEKHSLCCWNLMGDLNVSISFEVIRKIHFHLCVGWMCRVQTHICCRPLRFNVKMIWESWHWFNFICGAHHIWV